jgi:hypothetical protein
MEKPFIDFNLHSTIVIIGNDVYIPVSLHGGKIRIFLIAILLFPGSPFTRMTKESGIKSIQSTIWLVKIKNIQLEVFQHHIHATLFKPNYNCAQLLITESFNFHYINQIQHISRDITYCCRILIVTTIKPASFLLYIYTHHILLQLICYNNINNLMVLKKQSYP